MPQLNNVILNPRVVLIITALLTAISSIAVAETNSPIQINSYRIETEDCPGCGVPKIASEADVIAYLNHIREIAADGHGENDFGSNSFRNRDSDDEQVIFIDFDAGGEPTFPVCTTDGALFGIFQDHVYTPRERRMITSRIKRDYKKFNFSVVSKRPEEGEFTTLFVGQNDAPLDCSQGSNISVTPTGGVSILFGAADGIDFRNQIKSDNAFADASFWEFLAQLDPSGGLFEAFSGLIITDFDNLNDAVSQAVINQTANTGAHEVGHLQGLRHQNSFGAPGDGLPSTGAVSPFDFVPVFDGPSNATETVLHTMASGASVGLTLEGSTITDRFFSERSATRLAIAEKGKISNESQLRNNNMIRLKEIDVPNTILVGVNADTDLEVEGRVVQGEISTVGEMDRYRFRAKAGEFLNAELISVIGENLSFADGIIGQLVLYLAADDGSLTPIAENFQSFESIFDAEIFDAPLPVDGEYVIEVSAPDVFYPADFVGSDGILDPFPLSLAGGEDLLTGRYSLQIYTCYKELDDDDDD